MSTGIQNLLVIRLGAMGDLLHVSPSFEQLKAAYPDMHIHVLTSPTFEPLMTTFPTVHRVWTFEKGAHWFQTLARLWDLAEKLKAAHVDGIVTLQPNLRSWLLTQLVLGLFSGNRTASYRKEKLRATPLQERALLRRHAVTDFYAPFQRLFNLDPKDHQSLIPQLPHPLVPPQTPINLPTDRPRIGVIVGVGGKRANRAWPLEHYQTLLPELAATTGARFILIGGSDEQAVCAQLAETLPDCKITNSCGMTSILETAWVLSECDLVIGGDTGPLHLAAAAGTPIVTLFGPTSAKRTGPLGHQPITTLTPPDTLDFWPCEKPDCRQHSNDPHACTRAISVQDALQACTELVTSTSLQS